MSNSPNISASRMQKEGPAARQAAIFNALLLGLILVSAFGTIYSTHACRALYTTLQTLESAQWYLQEDYGRLLLEQSTQASHYRVEKVARADLDMVAPDIAQFKVVPR